MIRSFTRDEKGNFGVISAIVVLPLILATGAAVDLSRMNSAQNHLQNIADSAAITMATAPTRERSELVEIGERSVRANVARSAISSVQVEWIETEGDELSIALRAPLDMTFMRLAGYGEVSLDAMAAAKRDVGGAVEVALVLDNTYSMIGPGLSGDKIRTLKAASVQLIDMLSADPTLDVRIALVPYANYVNVGLEHRGASWIAEEQRRPANCRTVTEGRQCLRHAPTYSCTQLVDGNAVPGTCGGECLEEKVVKFDPPREQCDSDTRRWWGCVGSRTGGTPPNRLHDQNPSSRYIGAIDGHRNCPTPVLPLTDDRQRLLEAVSAMTPGGQPYYYKPLTYIPAGLIWGQNVLSPGIPFTEGAAYDPEGRSPRKVMVLMTDGDNTMMFHPSSGLHGNLRGGDVPEHQVPMRDRSKREEERKETNDDSLAICAYSKSHGIEIYTVSFMVETEMGRGLMRDCASGPEYYFDATNQDELLRAFEGIAGSISRVRLSQ